MIRKEVAQRILNHLKGTPDAYADGAFRHFVKKSGFALVDLQSVGISYRNQFKWGKSQHGTKLISI